MVQLLDSAMIRNSSNASNFDTKSNLKMQATDQVTLVYGALNRSMRVS